MMNCSCDQAKEMMAAAWASQLDGSSSILLQNHLDQCPECAAEMVALGGMWEKLGALPAPEPGLAMRARWEQTMDAIIASQHAAPGYQAPRQPWWRNLWPSNPAWQMAIAGLCLAAGLGAGSYLKSGANEREEVAQLRQEVASTKEMVALSMLQQQSAVERLRGVDYSARMPSMEPQVVTALIQAVNRDSNVNVRLAAIDALGKVAGDSKVRESMQQALPQQDSPMVQAALIDYLMDAHDRSAVGTLNDLVSKPDLNPSVRERATFAVHRLTQQ
jgi:hypothetical protein